MGYTDTLATDLDWVRFLIWDTDTSAEKLSDNEINAVLADQTPGAGTKARRYLAAAECIDVLRLRLAALGDGLMEKKVEDLRLRWGMEDTVGDVLGARQRYLAAMGSRYMLAKTKRTAGVL